jgi:2-polyprenyl-6-hydroxyphenyl methylase/3-demethylubiquinone-9 3-methyltransferase
MPVNNEIYSSQSTGWWDENHFFHLLKTGINPARFGYFKKVLLSALALDPQNLTVLDVGCGGGILSEEFARLGCHVTGVDPALPSLETARRHAEQQGYKIDYRQGRGESLPFPGGSFDVVACCDVFEHQDNLKAVIQDIARVLVPGGILFYDTLNRTERSRLENIVIAQDFPLTSFFQRGTHAWDMFVRPEELLDIFEGAGLQPREMSGIHSELSDLQVAGLLVRRKLSLLSYAELGRRLKFKTGGDLHSSYRGWAVKQGSSVTG